MGKVRRLAGLLRGREFFLGLAGTFAAFLGAASALLSITGVKFQIGAGMVVILAVLMAALLYRFRGLVAPQVAVDDVLSSDNQDALLTRLNCPCDLALSNEAKKLAQHCYATSVTIDPDLYEQLRVKNPYILACLTNARGKFLGYFDIIPLTESFAAAFLRGSVTEMQITHEDVLPPGKMRQCKHLFIAGVAVIEPNSHAGRRNANILIWGLLKYLAHFYGSAEPLCFAVAATRAGDHLLHRFRINLQSEATFRKDGYRLYSLPLKMDEIEKRLSWLPDWQLLCVLDWSNRKRNGRSKISVRRPPLPPTKPWNLDPTAIQA